MPNNSKILLYLQALPSTRIDVALQSPGNHALDPAFQPYLPQQGIISLLIQEQLVVTSQSRVHLAVLVQVRRSVPSAVVEVDEENHAFANVDEEPNLAAASVTFVSI